MPQMQKSLNTVWKGMVELLGVDLNGLDSSSAELTLYWRALAEMEEDYTVFVHLVAADGAPAGQVDRMPQGGAYPTSLWAAGEVIADQYQIPVMPDAVLPLSLRVGMYLPTTGEQLGEVVIPE